MAKSKRKRRRPNAGPPPAPAAKRAPESKSEARARQQPKRKSGEPVRPSFKGVLTRSLIVAAIFYPVLVYLAGESPGAAALVSGIAFLLMLPFGLLLDRTRYRMQMRRYARERPGRTSP